MYSVSKLYALDFDIPAAATDVYIQVLWHKVLYLSYLLFLMHLVIVRYAFCYIVCKHNERIQKQWSRCFMHHTFKI